MSHHHTDAIRLFGIMLAGTLAVVIASCATAPLPVRARARHPRAEPATAGSRKSPSPVHARTRQRS